MFKGSTFKKQKQPKYPTAQNNLINYQTAIQWDTKQTVK